MTARFPIRKNIIRRGAKIFIFCTVLGLLAVYFLNEGATVSIPFHTFNIQFILLIFLLTGFDYLLGGNRVWYVARITGKRISLFNAIRADLSNTFLSSVTPMQTGGGAAQLYILNQSGLKLGEAMAVSFVNFMFTVLFLFSISGFLIITGNGLVTSGLVSNLFRFGYIFFCFLLVLGFMIKWRPGIAFWFIRGFKKVSHFIFPNYKQDVEMFFSKLVEHLRIWWENFSFLFKKRKWHLLGGFGFTVILFLNKYTMAYCIIRGLGVSAGYCEVLFAMVILNSLLYFSPSPGASGIAEIAAASIMGTMIPGAYIMSFILIWRLFSSYLGVSLGAAVIYKALSSTIDSAMWKYETTDTRQLTPVKD